MKNSNKIKLLLLLSFLLLWSCKKSTDPEVTPPTNQNLILNPSFESKSGPGTDGWTFRDSTIYTFFQDAPDGGDRYSIVLRTVWRGPFSFNSVTARAALPVGNYHYRISCWGKRLSHGAGSLNLFVGSGDIDTMMASVTISIMDTIWTYYSEDIYVANPSSDSIVVALHGGYSPVGYPDAATFFDLCKFEKLD